MGHFGNKLAELLRANGRSQADLARLTGLSEAHISRLISDDQRRVSLEDLALIATNATDEKFQRAELVRAHLMDNLKGPGSELIEMRIAGEASSGQRAGGEVLPARVEECFRVLRAHHADKRVRTILEGVAALLEDVSSERVDTVPSSDTERIAIATLKGRKSGPGRAKP